MHHKLSRTKTLATLGPATTETVLNTLIKKGISGFRINMAHGTSREHKKWSKMVKNLRKTFDLPLPLLFDLPGPKLRIGNLRKEPIFLKTGSYVYLTDNPESIEEIPFPYPEYLHNLKRNDTVFISDGFIRLRVSKKRNNTVLCRVIEGGVLTSRKGVHIPGVQSEKIDILNIDRQRIDFALNENADLIGLSFISDPQEIINVKRYIRRKTSNPPALVAKIENKQAVENLDGIIKESDIIMVARGDLGIELPVQNVPLIQKKIITKSKFLCKPVITATQVMESMTENPIPLRAEVTDCANAVLDGTDAIMFSEETAIGKYPVKVLENAIKIMKYTERYGDYYSDADEVAREYGKKHLQLPEDFISYVSHEAQKMLNVDFILTPTVTGSTPRRIVRFRPSTWVLALTGNERVFRNLALSYGILPFYLPDFKGTLNKMFSYFKKKKILKKGMLVVVTSGYPPNIPGKTNTLQVVHI